MTLINNTKLATLGATLQLNYLERCHSEVHEGIKVRI